MASHHAQWQTSAALAGTPPIEVEIRAFRCIFQPRTTLCNCAPPAHDPQARTSSDICNVRRLCSSPKEFLVVICEWDHGRMRQASERLASGMCGSSAACRTTSNEKAMPTTYNAMRSLCGLVSERGHPDGRATLTSPRGARTASMRCCPFPACARARAAQKGTRTRHPGATLGDGARRVAQPGGPPIQNESPLRQ